MGLTSDQPEQQLFQQCVNMHVSNLVIATHSSKLILFYFFYCYVNRKPGYRILGRELEKSQNDICNFIGLVLMH